MEKETDKATPRHKGPGSLVMMLLVAVGHYFKHYFYQGDADWFKVTRARGCGRVCGWASTCSGPKANTHALSVSLSKISISHHPSLKPLRDQYCVLSVSIPAIHICMWHKPPAHFVISVCGRDCFQSVLKKYSNVLQSCFII